MMKKSKILSILEWLLLLVLIGWLLTSCSCQKRMDRLRKHCPECFSPTVINVNDTVITPGKIICGDVDLFSLMNGEVVTVETPDFHLDFLMEGDTLNFHGQTTPDTVINTLQVPVEVPVIVEKDIPWPWIISIGLSAVVITFIVARKKHT